MASTKGTGHVTAPLPSISMAYINRAGKLSASGLHYMLQTATQITTDDSNTPYIGSPWMLMEQGIASFMVAIKVKVYEPFHRISHRYGSVCLQAEVRVTHLGHTSYQSTRTISDRDTGEVMLEAVTTTVAVDLVTRKPRALPTWFKDVVDRNQLSPPLEKNIPDFTPADKNSYRSTFTVGISDTDFNHHLNQAVFVRFAFDGAWNACNKDFFENFQGDLCDYEIAEQNISYLKQAFLGDTLSVDVWETNGDIARIHAVISRLSDMARLFYVDFVFYPKTPSFDLQSKL